MAKQKQSRKSGRGAASKDAVAAESYKATIDEAAEELVCPITMELPVDPVTAEDGRTYERSAIEELIETAGDGLRSPVTNLPMGPRLSEAVQVRNVLEKLVQSRAITGSKADRWKERIEDKKKVEETRKEAEDGDVGAMTYLGICYEYSLHGLEGDAKMAFNWYRKAAGAGCISAMGGMGECLIDGFGVKKNKTEGAALLGASAQGGSAYAAYLLGKYYFFGMKGFPKDWNMAKLWLAQVGGNREVKDYIAENHVSEAKEFLQEIMIEEQSDSSIPSRREAEEELCDSSTTSTEEEEQPSDSSISSNE